MSAANRWAPQLRAAIVCLGVATLSGCASESLRPDFEEARQLILDSTGQAEVYDPQQPPLSGDQLRAALADGLDLDEALRLALLNNRSLQAGFMGLGIARADYVQAGLLENPTLGLAFLFPAGGGGTRLAADLAANVLELWQIPHRQAAAEAQQDQRVLELGRLAGTLVADVQLAYYESVAATNSLELMRSSAELAREAAQASRQLVALGLATELEGSLAQDQALRSQLSAQQAQQARSSSARRLASLLSLTLDLSEVPLTTELATALLDPSAPPWQRDELVSHARRTRLDLSALAAAVAAAEARIALEDSRAYPEIRGGLSYEQPETGDPTDHLLGPALEIELPVFDDKQAGRSRARFELEQLRRLYEALDADLQQAVRSAADRYTLALESAQFVRQELEPSTAQAVQLARQAYDAGSMTLPQLLELRAVLVQTQTSTQAALLEVARARVELERELGGPLP